MSLPRLLLIQPEPRSRLRAVVSLRELVEVEVPEAPDPRVVRLVRKTRPDAVLLALGPGRLSPGLAVCRSIKTDQGRPPLVGLTDPWSRLRHPDAALTGCLGDGYLGGVADDQALQAFVADLLAGRRPVHVHPPAAGLLGRVLNRLHRG